MIDTSAMLAALLTQHEHHALARPHLPNEGPVPAIVLAEVYAQLRRTFALTADAATGATGLWALNGKRIAALPTGAYSDTFARARALDLGGNIHDALIAKTCAPPQPDAGDPRPAPTHHCPGLRGEEYLPPGLSCRSPGTA